MTLRIDQHILRLYIAVTNAFYVAVVHSLQHLICVKLRQNRRKKLLLLEVSSRKLVSRHRHAVHNYVQVHLVLLKLKRENLPCLLVSRRSS